jgi:hypothetical protein
MAIASKIEIGWEGLMTVLTGMAVAAATVWGGIQANKADIAAMRESIELIREDTQYLRGRFDNLEDSDE